MGAFLILVWEEKCIYPGVPRLGGCSAQNAFSRPIYFGGVARFGECQTAAACTDSMQPQAMATGEIPGSLSRPLTLIVMNPVNMAGINRTRMVRSGPDTAHQFCTMNEMHITANMPSANPPDPADVNMSSRNGTMIST